MHDLKAESYVLFGGHTEDSHPVDTLSNHSAGLLQRGKGGAGIYRSFCLRKKHVVGHEKITAKTGWGNLRVEEEEFTYKLLGIR